MLLLCCEDRHGRQMGSALSPEQVDKLKTISEICIYKMRYSPHYDFNREGDRELEFQEFRKELKSLFDAITKLVLRQACHFISSHWPGCQSDVFRRAGHHHRCAGLRRAAERRLSGC